jgi:hypothetical protein
MDSGLDPRKLAEQMIDLSANNIIGQTIPTDGFGTSQSGQSVVLVTPSKVKAFVDRLIGKASASPAPHASSSAHSSATSSSPKPSPTATGSKPIDAGCIY